MLKRKGFLINLLTNACLVTDRYIEFFKQYPPREVEVTVYGVTEATYEAVSRIPSSFRAFKHGLDLLLSNGIPVTLKAIAMQSNKHEFKAISSFCSERTHLPFRFDPTLHLRYDRDPARNAEIKQERLEPDEVVALEMADALRFNNMQKNCDALINLDKVDYHTCTQCKDLLGCEKYTSYSKLFSCGIGTSEFNISYDGQLRLCTSLSAPGTTVDLLSVSLKDGLAELRTRIKGMQTQSIAILETCKSCSIANLCLWCPALAYLETGDLEGEVPYFCQVAHARADALQNRILSEQE